MKKIIPCNHCGAINKVDVGQMKIKSAVCGKCAQNLETTPNLISIDEKKLNQVISHAELPVVIDVFAHWCGPCKVYGPIFEDVTKEMWNEAEFYKLDIEKNAHFTSKNNIRGVPATLLFLRGKLVKNQSGLLDKKQLKSFIQSVKDI